MAKTKSSTSTRRDFLKLSGIGTAAGAAVIAGVQKPAEAAVRPEKVSAGYRETAHVKTAYALSRF
ncbi:twin-arginine translocation signal domain-containing protein [Nisaea sp.]|uniref:twin-arginine translocation signal domain-containing protein n=1 Tax=Nisaea sp. TaxID=2024842 RepID=UPI0032EED984